MLNSSKPYINKGEQIMATRKQSRKTFQRELQKSLRQNTKKTKQRKQMSQEHQLFSEIDNTFKD